MRGVAINLHDLAPEARAPFASLGLPLLADAVPGHAGPLAGVLAGLDYAAAKGFDACSACPATAPFLPMIWRRGFTRPRENPGGLACAASGGRAHHMVALWPTFLREDLRRALDD